jgi:hypothetical protein
VHQVTIWRLTEIPFCKEFRGRRSEFDCEIRRLGAIRTLPFKFQHICQQCSYSAGATVTLPRQCSRLGLVEFVLRDDVPVTLRREGSTVFVDWHLSELDVVKVPLTPRLVGRDCLRLRPISIHTGHLSSTLTLVLVRAFPTTGVAQMTCAICLAISWWTIVSVVRVGRFCASRAIVHSTSHAIALASDSISRNF